MPGFIVLLFVLFAVAIWFATFSMDRQRIANYVEERGGRIISIDWAPFGRGWFGEKNDRIFEVVYYDNAGNQHFFHLQNKHVERRLLDGRPHHISQVRLVRFPFAEERAWQFVDQSDSTRVARFARRVAAIAGRKRPAARGVESTRGAIGGQLLGSLRLPFHSPNCVFLRNR